MGDQYIIGLDVGTSVTKAALFDRALGLHHSHDGNRNKDIVKIQ